MMSTHVKNPPPTIFHITHWKAGSQWLYRILMELAPERIVPPVLGEKQFFDAPLVPGGVYPTVYVTREELHSVALPENYSKFVIIRDLRDTLVSAYFSFRYSHPVIDDRVTKGRQELEAMRLEEGLLHILDNWLPICVRIQESWIASGERIIRYEDLLERDCEILGEVLLGEGRMPVSPDRFREVILHNRFEQMTGGRPRGVEDIHKHERKGVAGDWRNYFTPLVTERFNARYGDLLARTGYA